MKKFIAILLMCQLLLPICAVAEPENIEPMQSQELETVTAEDSVDLDTNEVNNAEDTMLPAQIPATNDLKQPISKKQLAIKFIIAMLCVAGCSIFLYLSLSVYNRIREGFAQDETPLTENEEPLDSPQDLTEAVKTFVDKTRWRGV